MNALLERSAVHMETPAKWIVAQQMEAAELEQWCLPLTGEAITPLTIMGFDSALDDEGKEKHFVQFEMFNHTTATEYTVQISATEHGEWVLVVLVNGMSGSSTHASFDDAMDAAYRASES